MPKRKSKGSKQKEQDDDEEEDRDEEPAPRSSKRAVKRRKKVKQDDDDDDDDQVEEMPPPASPSKAGNQKNKPHRASRQKAPSTRGRKRRMIKSPKSADNNSDNDGDEEDVEESVPSIKTSEDPPKDESVKKSDDAEDDNDDDDDYNENEDNNSSADEDNTSTKSGRKQQKGPGGKKRKQSTSSSSPSSTETVCEYCNKTFRNAFGLKYHLKQKVCQKTDAEIASRPHPGKRSKTEASGKAFPRIRGKKSDRTCPNCDKVFTSVLGCEYHVSRGVCKKQVKTAAERPPLHTLEPGDKFLTMFGVVEVVRDDRAVPMTPKPTAEEHIEEKNESVTNENEGSADGKLDGEDANIKGEGGEENERSETKSSDNGKPSSKKRKKRSDRMKLYRSALSKRKSQIDKARSAVFTLNLVKRKRLARAYEKGDINQNSVWRLTYGDDPRNIPPACHKQFVEIRELEMEDPSAPASSFPDRMVECRWVHDRRTRFLGMEDQMPELVEPPSLRDNRPNIFLRRRELTTPYDEKMVSYTCNKCFTKFLSKTGMTYHTKKSICSSNEKNTEKEEQHRETLVTKRVAERTEFMATREKLAVEIMAKLDAKDERARRTVPAPSVSQGSKEPDNNHLESFTQGNSDALTGGVKVEESADATNNGQSENDVSASTNPLSELELELKEALPHKKSKKKSIPPSEMNFAAPRLKTQKELKMEPRVDPKFEDPRVVLRELESEWRYLQSKYIGPVYPSVLTALGFLEPNDKLKRKRRSKKQIEEDKRRKEEEKKRQEEEKIRIKNENKPPPQPVPVISKPPPQPDYDYTGFLDSMRHRPLMIDTRVLIHEIDMGRYPSINRQAANGPPKKAEEVDKCYVCKQNSGHLEKCNFCPRKVHMSCARLKYSLRDPEPFDDFLCTQCINYILQRRNRAERRRLEKLKGIHIPGPDVTASFSTPNPIPLHREAEKGREYEAVVSQARHMANLVDLAAHTRERLQLEIDSVKVNDIRSQLMK